MNLRTLTEQWLRANGYDGLLNDSIECGCKVGDLMPCDEPSSQCEPGHFEECDGSCLRGECDWHIAPGKSK